MGSEATWKKAYPALLGYLRDSMSRFDQFNPNGGALTDDELGLWDPFESPKYVQRDSKLDLAGDLHRPVIIMHGTFDSTVSPRETAGYKRLVEKKLGREGAERFLAVYYIPEWAMAERSSTILWTSRSMHWKHGRLSPE